MPCLLSAPSPCLLPLPLCSFLLFFLKNVHGSKIWRQNQKTPTSPRFVPKWTLVSRKKNSNKIFLFCSLPSIYLWIQVTHQTHRSLGVFGWAQAPPLFQGYMQNQMPAVTKGTLTFDFENALMLLPYFKGQGWGHTRHMLTTSCDLLPSRELSRAVLQTETYIFFFSVKTKSTPNSLADSSSLPHFMIFFLLLYFRKELFPAGIYVHNCWELMELASNSVYVSNGTRQGQWWQEEHMYRLSLFCLLQSLMSCWEDARQKTGYATGFTWRIPKHFTYLAIQGWSHLPVAN